ncbi:MAG: DUF520 family protein [Elusimicrobia bacterium]|nr:DUF520 family protein [Elusimicrobiota bacterium]
MAKLIKDLKSKATASIQGEQVRISSRSKDELQSIMAALRGKDFGVEIQFANFR